MSEKAAACLWHAYSSLSEQSGKDFVVRGQLKVLTQSLASLFQLTGIDNKLEERFAPDAIISFSEYLGFMEKEVFRQMISNDRNSFHPIPSLDRIEEVCWLICSKMYLKQSHGVLKTIDVYKLWRLFNYLAETDVSDHVICPVVVHHEEAEIICEKIVSILAMEHRNLDFESITSGFEHLGFAQFLHMIEGHCFTGLKDSVMGSAIAELFDDQVVQVLKKGYLQRKGQGRTGGWREHWCVLTVAQFCLYSNRDENDLRETVQMTASCSVENVTEKSGITVLNIGLGAKPNRFVLNNGPKQTIELSSNDGISKTEWLNAFESALDWSRRGSSPKLLMLKLRKEKRAEKKEKLKKEAELKMLQEEEISKTRMELDAEKRARQDAEDRILQEEARCREEQMQSENTRRQLEEEKQIREQTERLLQEETELRMLEQQKLQELEQMRRGLEMLLEAEQEAKSEAEVVKAMQAKILQEEFDRREHLERMQMELEELLQEEQLKNMGLEEIRTKQEEFIRSEEERLKTLMVEKATQEQEYQTAVLKLQEAEQMKAEMEQQLRVKEEEQAKLSLTIVKSPFSPTMTSHRGMGAFVDKDYTKRNDLTPMSPNSPSYNLVRICRTPISPPVLPDVVRSNERSNEYRPPVPERHRKRNALGSSNSQDQE